MNPRVDFVQVELDGVQLKLWIDMNALVAFEEVRGKNPAAVFGDFDLTSIQSGEEEEAGWAMLRALSFIDLRAAWWACLQRHHSEITIEDAGRLLDFVNFVALMRSLPDLIRQCFPGAEDAVEDSPPFLRSTGSPSRPLPSRP